jgi:hypothetical protein
MNRMKHIWASLVAMVVKHNPAQTLSNKQEIERLDRLRNPSKYLGK